MKRSRFLNGAALAALLLATPLALAPMTGRALAQTNTENTSTVTVESFHDRLTPVGDYLRVDGLGEVWKPRQVGADWQPYSNGRWIFNDKVGWYFESDEPWAEITYHYGRWYEDPNQGWVWVAGTDWAPAWVEWRRSKQFVGWRPLPPDNAPRRVAARTQSRSARTTARNRNGAPETVEEEWIFIPADRIVSEDIRSARVERTRVTEIYEESRPIGRVERRGSLAVNFAIQPQVLERESRVTIHSQNLPEAVAAPVPAQIRSIATEQRTTRSTAGTTTSGATGAGGASGAGEARSTGSTATGPDKGQPATVGSTGAALTSGSAKSTSGSAKSTSGSVKPNPETSGSTATRDEVGPGPHAGKPDAKGDAASRTASDKANPGDTTSTGGEAAPKQRAGDANRTTSGDANSAAARKRPSVVGTAPRDAGGEKAAQQGHGPDKAAKASTDSSPASRSTDRAQRRPADDESAATTGSTAEPSASPTKARRAPASASAPGENRAPNLDKAQGGEKSPGAKLPGSDQRSQGGDRPSEARQSGATGMAGQNGAAIAAGSRDHGGSGGVNHSGGGPDTTGSAPRRPPNGAANGKGGPSDSD